MARLVGEWQGEAIYDVDEDQAAKPEESPMSNATTGARRVTCYMDGIDWEESLGRDAFGTALYPSSRALKAKQKHDPEQSGCGIALVEVRFLEWVAPPDEEKRWATSHEVQPSGLIVEKEPDGRWSIKLRYDPEAKVWTATSDSVPGLVTEAPNPTELGKKIDDVLHDLVGLNRPSPDTPDPQARGE